MRNYREFVGTKIDLFSVLLAHQNSSNATQNRRSLSSIRVSSQTKQ